ncbi:zinc-dependent alcohol dehydrogenase family protein [Metasolibacillus sp.]|uniref:zinc-dependent alcohol dehydrogenase family protein n=1 Tax=Metasolibacillus sp. TaxID=2703680 RepID=UPI0025E397B3|nr:zinc-dependent alcohol dehydrogenase family protein [Metasolibacillus sp.]MCT6924882.1 zinc-dependent alcohol dehydrogenase family protein [Metasolibacillus sp.]MCT6941150.1 zinc-dependent alcohol dehydrogenase family protein [Metasolibacillus sp.]
MMNKYAIFHQFGKPQEVLEIHCTAVKQLARDEILVRMLARPINPSDLIPIRGSYAHRISLPTIPGYEGVGIVEEVGAAVSKSLIGQRVLPLRGEGTWQKYVKAPANLAIRVPQAIDNFTAAQMYINPVTAWVICTDILNLKPSDVLVVNACGSAIGHVFAQLSKGLGFRLIAITRNAIHTKQLLALGASDVICSEDAVGEKVLTLTNGLGASAAIDSIGGTAGTELAFSLRPEGQFLTIGLLSGIQVDWTKIAKEAQVNAAIFHLRHWNKRISITHWQNTFQQLITLIERQQLTFMPATAEYNLVDVKEAVRHVESVKNRLGKVFLV